MLLPYVSLQGAWKIENLIRCLANFKAQIEYKKIDFNADKIKQYKTVTEAMNSASLKYLFFYSLFSNSQ